MAFQIIIIGIELEESVSIDFRAFVIWAIAHIEWRMQEN